MNTTINAEMSEHLGLTHDVPTSCVTAQELVDFLKTSPPKGAGQFETADGKCCLGHYASLCEMPYLPGQGKFWDPIDVSKLSRYVGDRAALPATHWIVPHMHHLILLNDASHTFAEVIEYLERAVLAGEDALTVYTKIAYPELVPA